MGRAREERPGHGTPDIHQETGDGAGAESGGDPHDALADEVVPDSDVRSGEWDIEEDRFLRCNHGLGLVALSVILHRTYGDVSHHLMELGKAGKWGYVKSEVGIGVGV